MNDEHERPPFLNTWNNVYLLLTGSLVCTILFLYLFTWYFK